MSAVHFHPDIEPGYMASAYPHQAVCGDPEPTDWASSDLADVSCERCRSIVEEVAHEAAGSPDADGGTFDPDRDGNRIGKQRQAVWALMRDGQWRTLGHIAAETHSPEASVSARLRDFRKAKYGHHTVERRYVHDGLWEYRVLPNEVGVAVGMPDE